MAIIPIMIEIKASVVSGRYKEYPPKNISKIPMTKLNTSKLRLFSEYIILTSSNYSLTANANGAFVRVRIIIFANSFGGSGLSFSNQ